MKNILKRLFITFGYSLGILWTFLFGWWMLILVLFCYMVHWIITGKEHDILSDFCENIFLGIFISEYIKKAIHYNN